MRAGRTNSKSPPLAGVASLLTQPSWPHPRKSFSGTWHPQTLLPQQRWATELPPPTAHLCTWPLALVLFQATSSGTDWDQEREGSRVVNSVPTADPSSAGTEAGGGGAACGRNQGAGGSLSQADGAPRRPSQALLPSSPLPSSPHRGPPLPRPSPASSSGKVRCLRNLYFCFNELRRSPTGARGPPLHLSAPRSAPY